MSATDIFPPQLFSIPGTRTYEITFRNPSGNTVLNFVDVNVSSYGAESRRSVVTPGFKQAIRTGNLPESPFYYQKSSFGLFNGTVNWSYPGDYGADFKQRGVQPAAFMLPPEIGSISSARRFNLDNEVKQKVMDKVRDSDVNVAVAWGERHETLKTISGALQRLASAYNHARSGDWAGAAASLGSSRGPVLSRGNLASNWLELQYGWLPLMSDIYGAVNSMSKKRHKEFVIIRSRKSIRDSVVVNTVNGAYADVTTESAEYTSSCRVKMRCSSSSLKIASELGLTNPLLVAWELVPFSFVVDWALPIGSFISQFDASLGWTFESGGFTRFYKCTSVTTRSVPVVPPGYSVYDCDGSAKSEFIECSRSGVASFLDLLTIPYLKDPSSLKHIANALALLTSKR